jgi:PRTRC genetic system protein E
MFFQELSKLLQNTDITISVRGGVNHITVSVLPKSTAEPGKHKENPVLPVMTLSGSPAEMDAEFFKQINAPIQTATAFLVNHSLLQKAAKEKEDEAKKKLDKKSEKTSEKKSAPKPETKVEEKEEKEEAVDAAQCSLF